MYKLEFLIIIKRERKLEWKPILKIGVSDIASYVVKKLWVNNLLL